MKLLKGLVLLALVVPALPFPLIVLYRFVPPPVTTFQLIQVPHHLYYPATRERVGGFPWIHKDWTSDLPPHVGRAMVASEDQKFPVHEGFDLESIEKAYRDRQRGRRARGASTISQQVVKNLFLWPGPSWVRKGLEAVYTTWLEFVMPKDRILLLYMNIAEFGPGVYGAQAAAERYFGKDASELTRGEAALMAAVLPNPTRYRLDRPGPYVRGRQGWILRQMARM